MTTRYRTAFMAPSGFTAAAPGTGTKSVKRIAPATGRKMVIAPRPHSRVHADPVTADQRAKTEAA